jgi:tetratricopeptide (TPR) repeat protein
MDPYEGSPSLSGEAREKVLQTFRHTLHLVRDGRNEEALLGCDFILKMDARFVPAHRLLASLRGVPAGQRIDMASFASYFEAPRPGAPAPAPVPETAPPPAPGPLDAAPAPKAPSAPAAPSTGLDDLVFDDFAPAARAAPTAPTAASPAAMAAPFPETSFADLSDLSSGVPPPAAPAFSQTAAPGPGPVFEDLDMSATARPAGAAGAPAAPPSAPAAAPGPRPAEISSPALDPRIAQFLKQGDDAIARGNPQEAIDLWSRVFLIDLSNEEASRRIDAARETLAETARKVDVLLAEGVQRYEAGDLAGARARFVDVLTRSEHDTTARSYLNQIDAALVGPSAAGAPQGDSEFLRTEIEAPRMPSFAEEGEGPDPSRTVAVVVADESAPVEMAPPRSATPRRKSAVDLRLLIPVGALLLAVVAALSWWLFRSSRKTGPVAGVKGPAAAPSGAAAGPKAAQDDPIAKAQALFDQGKVDAAIQALLAIPDNDPRRNEALTKIDQFRNAGVPTPAPPAPSAATLDDLRVQGFAAMKASKYIDAVKALDAVAKARPDDAETAQALRRARENVNSLRSAVKSYAEADYESAIKLLWELRTADPKNQDVEDYLLNSYVNSGIQSLQSGNTARAIEALHEAVKLRPTDTEAQRLLKFARKYPKGANDLMGRIFVRHLSLRP